MGTLTGSIYAFYRCSNCAKFISICFYNNCGMLSLPSQRLSVQYFKRRRGIWGLLRAYLRRLTNNIAAFALIQFFVPSITPDKLIRWFSRVHGTTIAKKSLWAALPPFCRPRLGRTNPSRGRSKLRCSPGPPSS